MRALLALTALFTFSISSAFSETILVPEDYPRIQSGIVHAQDGDVVDVAPGLYQEKISFLGKAITVRSRGGPELTIIDGFNAEYPQWGSVVFFIDAEGQGSVLEGFTIRGGTGVEAGMDVLGGGIYCEGTSPTIRGNIIRDNTAIASSGHGRGGGIYCDGEAPVIVDNVIAFNSATFGGGVDALGDHALIEGNVVHGNLATAAGAGAGIACWGQSPRIIGNDIFDNDLSFAIPGIGGGGGIFCNGDTPYIADNDIHHNCGGEGGGIYTESLFPIITANRIYANTADGPFLGYGGGIWAGRGQANLVFPTITNNVVFDNSALSVGGGIYLGVWVPPFSGPSLTPVVNNTVVRNSAGARGGGLAIDGTDSVDVSNTILWDNVSALGPEIALSGADLAISYSDVQGGQDSVYVSPGSTLLWGSGMIDADPRFVDPGLEDWHITYDSPCRDVGSATVPGLPESDFEGNARIEGSHPDMGADEFAKHLYLTGTPSPGNIVTLKLIGPGGETQVALAIGTLLYDPPLTTPFGEWHIAPPLALLPSLPPVPSTGVLILEGQIPASPPGPYTVYLQSLIGFELTQLLEMIVE